MDLRTAYEVSILNMDWIIFVFIAVTVIISIIFWTRRKRKTFFILWYCLWMILAGVGIVGSIYRHYSHIQWLHNGYCNVVEGNVENFNPMQYEGHKFESFTVQGIRFEYSDYKVNGGFNRTNSHGGPIYEGRWVQIYYKNGTILKLVVKKSEDKN